MIPTFEEWWAGVPLTYRGLGKHSSTTLTATISRPKDVPLPALRIVSDGVKYLDVMIGKERARRDYDCMITGT